MRRDATFWLGVAVAFILGLLPGLGLTAYQRQVAQTAVTKANASLAAERDRLASAETAAVEKLHSAEARATSLTSSVASLKAQLTRLRPTVSAVTSPSAAASRSAETTPVSTEPTRTTAPRDPVSFVNRSVAGSGVANSPLLLQVQVRGSADKVSMRLVNVQSGWTQTYQLDDTGTSSGVTTWKKTIATPATLGEYRYFADAFLGARSFSMPGVTKYSFSVR